jgi:uncharacterized protein (TIGR03435 family)
MRFNPNAILATAIIALWGLCPRATAQSSLSGQAAPPAPAFDVAAIHRHISEPHEHNSIWSAPSDSNFKAENVSLIGLIHWAFEMPETRILNAPAWASSTNFNIEASSDASANETMAHLGMDAGKARKEAMVRALLADRFKLKVHIETRELPVYFLVAGKGKPNLGDPQLNGTTINRGRDHLEVQGGDSVALLAEELAEEVGRPVIDKTGIVGRYDLRLRWTHDDAIASGAAPAPDAPPSIFTALEEQLGLKLASSKGPVKVLVVDHAEMPSEN